MELIKDTPFEIGWLVWMARPKSPCLTVVVKGTFTIVDEGTCPIDSDQVFLTGDIHQDDDVERSVRYESDMAYVKPQGECLIAGSCFAPGGRPATTVLAAFRVGTVQKKMAVIGDRHFKGIFGGQTKPEPFVEMPLCWERCFGGKKIKANPVGLGIDKSPINGKALVRLPNIENPSELMVGKRVRPKPHGAFPISRDWAARLKVMGTYDGRWQRTRWPYYPEDFQWTFFNAAPEDQRIKGFFRGDEEISLVGLHRDHEKVNCRLPGLRPRVFLRGADEGSFRSLATELDTITIDTDAGKALCLWRGVMEVPSEKLEEFAHIFVVHEEISVERPLDDYEGRMDELIAESAVEEEEHEDEEPPEEEAQAERFSPVPVPVSDELRSSWKPDIGIRGDLSDAIFSCGRGSSIRPSPFPDPVPLDSPILIPEMSEDEWEALHSTDYEVEDDDQATAAEPGWMMPMDQIIHYSRFEFEEGESGEASMGLQTAELLGRLSVPMSPEDGGLFGTEGDGEATTAFSPLMDEDLGAEDDLEGDATNLMTAAELSEAIFGEQPVAAVPPAAQGELVEPAAVTAESLAAPVSAEAPAWVGKAPSCEAEPAAPDAGPEGEVEAEPVNELREKVLAALEKGESCADWDLNGADLSGCDLARVDFQRASLSDANLADAKLDGAKLDGATLLRAELTGASFKGASLNDAVLIEARGCDLQMEKASLERAVANDATFPRARFAGCECGGFELAGADLAEARFESSKLDGADFTGARLDDAVFIESSLVEAELGGVSAKRVKMDGCDLEKLRAYEEGDFSDASFVKAKISGGRFMSSQMVGANFSFAELDGADFSEAKLPRAKMLGCTMKEARFDGATMIGVLMGKSDLFQARFENADLSQADLRGCNLFRAELLGADMRGAKLELANLKGTKLA